MNGQHFGGFGIGLVAALADAAPREAQDVVFIGSGSGNFWLERDENGPGLTDGESARMGIAALVQQAGLTSQWESEADAMLAWCVLDAAGFAGDRSLDLEVIIKELAQAGFIESPPRYNQEGYFLTPSQRWRRLAQVASSMAAVGVA